MKKPKYIIYDKFQEGYFLNYMRGYSRFIEGAYKYSEDDILDILNEDPNWLNDCIVRQTYEDQL